MKAEEGEGEGSEFSAVLESFFSFLFFCVCTDQQRENKQARTTCLHANVESVCANGMCVCVRVRSDILARRLARFEVAPTGR